MTRIGIIGVGEIAHAMVTGMCEGIADPPRVHLSPRGARNAAELAERYGNVEVRADNQDVVDHSDLVVVAVRAQDQSTALDGLRVGPEKVVLNVMGAVANGDLRRRLGTEAEIVKAIPLPTVRERRSITVSHPSHPLVNALFDTLGGSRPVADEAALNVCTALTSTLSTHYQYLIALASWAVERGLPPEDADPYLRGLFQGLGRSLGDPRPLEALAADHETPGGTNERIRTAWFDPSNVAALTRALDDLLASLADQDRPARPGAPQALVLPDGDRSVRGHPGGGVHRGAGVVRAAVRRAADLRRR